MQEQQDQLPGLGLHRQQPIREPGAAGGWQWQGRAQQGAQRGRPGLQQPKQQQQGVWTSQPRTQQGGPTEALYPRRQTFPPRQPPQQRARLQSPPGSSSEGEGLSESGDEADIQQQRRQRRQHTLRSLRQDLNQQQQPGRSAGSSMSGSLSDAGSESDSDGLSGSPAGSSGGGSRAGGGRAAGGPLQREARAPARSDQGSSTYRSGGGFGPSRSNGGSYDADGMLPDGYFLRSLQDSGVVDSQGQPTDVGSRLGVGFSSFMNVGINKLLAHSTDLGTIFCIVRDVGYLMDAINTSTAVHRVGKVVRRQRERDPGIVSEVLRNPLYHRLLVRVEELAPTSRPRALANTMWGLAGARSHACRPCRVAAFGLINPLNTEL